MNQNNDDTVHDNLLFNMLNECNTLPVFLDHIFGFLNRRTDFYYETTDKQSPVGMPPGFAEQIVRSTFFKWKARNEQNESSPPPPVLEEIEVESEPCEIPETVHSRPTTNATSPKSVSKKVEQNFTTSEGYNGATYDTYSWSQNILEVDIFIKLPEDTTRKNLIVEILPDVISVKLNNGIVILEGELRDKCRHKEAIWSLINNKLEVHLDKCKELWWNCLFTSEPKIDVSKLDCSRPFEELPEEAQAKIQELQWNQERKRLGLPTSEEMAMHSILKQAWNAEGSPFNGPFDPASVKFN